MGAFIKFLAKNGICVLEGGLLRIKLDPFNVPGLVLVPKKCPFSILLFEQKKHNGKKRQ